MSHEPKGSTPGPIHERKDLTRVNTFPSVEFSIPPSDPPDQIVTRCASRRTQGDTAQEQEKNGSEGDEEAQSVNENEVSYPEGGLQSWLVVLGGFMASFVGFGMMYVLVT